MDATLQLVSTYTFLLSKDYDCIVILSYLMKNSPELMKIQVCMKTRKSLLACKLQIDFHCLSRTLDFLILL